MKSGSATSRNSLLEVQAISPATRLTGRKAYICPSTRPSTPIAAATGMATSISASRVMSAVAIMVRA